MVVHPVLYQCPFSVLYKEMMICTLITFFLSHLPPPPPALPIFPSYPLLFASSSLLFPWPCLAACSLFCICWKLVYISPSPAFSSSVQSAILASIFAASSWPSHKATYIGPFILILSVLFLFLLLLLPSKKLTACR